MPDPQTPQPTEPSSERPPFIDSAEDAEQAPRRNPVKRFKKLVRRQAKYALQALGKRSPRFRDASRAAIGRRRARNWADHCTKTPVDNKTILFESFMGRSYSCSPKALYKAMLSDPAYADWTFIWAFKKPGRYAEHPDFGRATLVRYHSQRFYEGLAGARFWVTNSVMPSHVNPRESQVLIQTWHGTPLKRLGCDIEPGSSANALYSADDIHERYRREGKRLTWLLSPSRFATEKFTSAFDLVASGKAEAIIEEGYPRNDVLANYTRQDVVRVREELGIPAEKKVILYAPTWRDNQHTTGVGYTLELGVDFDDLHRDLGDDYVVLFRAHYFVANQFDFERYEGFVYDVSKVDDINELYIASDMLITDYSSVFFDYGNLKRPIIFYMYDLDDYTEDIRGFYFDLAELPGPIVKTEPELVQAILASATPDQATIARYEAFSATYTYLDDGKASERVLARVMQAAHDADEAAAAAQK